MIVGARISHADPRINVGFRDGTIIPAGARRDDAVRLVYSGGEPTLEKGERQIGESFKVLVLIMVLRCGGMSAKCIYNKYSASIPKCIMC